MGKISFPKHVSQGRRLLRNSPQQLGAPAVAMHHARLRGWGARRAWHQPRQKSQVVPDTAGTGMLSQSLPVLPHMPKQERKSPGRALMRGGLGAAQGSGQSGSASLGGSCPCPCFSGKALG